MNTVYILIDRTTIRENPDYKPGGYRQKVAGAKNGEFTITGKSPVMPEEFESDILLTEYPLLSEGDWVFTIKKFSDELMEWLKNVKANVTISNPLIEVTSSEPPKFLYEYLDTNILCEGCLQMIPHEKIQSGNIGIYEQVYVESCPNCGEVNSFPERRYESLQESNYRASKE